MGANPEGGFGHGAARGGFGGGRGPCRPFRRLLFGAKGAQALGAGAGGPLSCTSDKSTEAYRLFWPGDEDLAALVRESLDLLSPFAGVARPNRRGYLYVGRLEALAAWALGEEAPAWARAFAPGRFLDPAYRPKEGAARFQL